MFRKALRTHIRGVFIVVDSSSSRRVPITVVRQSSQLASKRNCGINEHCRETAVCLDTRSFTEITAEERRNIMRVPPWSDSSLCTLPTKRRIFCLARQHMSPLRLWYLQRRNHDPHDLSTSAVQSVHALYLQRGIQTFCDKGHEPTLQAITWPANLFCWGGRGKTCCWLKRKLALNWKGSLLLIDGKQYHNVAEKVLKASRESKILIQNIDLKLHCLSMKGYINRRKNTFWPDKGYIRGIQASSNAAETSWVNRQNYPRSGRWILRYSTREIPRQGSRYTGNTAQYRTREI